MAQLMYADEVLEPWLAELQRALGPFALFDDHVHVGLNDPAGFLVTEQEALRSIDLVGERAIVLALKEPTGYDEANERVARLAASAGGRLAWFARLDPAEDALRQARAGLDLGAAGLKLHPRGEGFEVSDPRLDGVFALADRERLPILVHTGPSSEGIGLQCLDRAREHPGARIILAHCAAGEMAVLWRRVGEHPNVFLDTAWWNPSDVLGLLQLVAPGKILYGSDIPFTSPAQAAFLTLCLGAQAALGADQLAAVMGGQLDALLRRDEPLAVGPAPGVVREPLHPLLERIYVYLLAALEPMMRGEEPGQPLDQARDAAALGDDGPHAQTARAVLALLDAAEERETRDPGRQQRTPGFDLVMTAAVVARSPAVPVAVPRAGQAAG